MTRRRRTRIFKRTLGSVLGLLGILVWAVSATHHPASHDAPGSVSRLEERSLGSIAGGASIVGGVMLLAASV